MPSVSDVSGFLERFAPSKSAAEWDNVGLLLGDASQSATRIMTCLTVTPDVVAEAVEERVELIVSHHPILFRGTKKLTSRTSEGRLLLPLLANRIAVYSPHTAFDNCRGGINEQLGQLLGMTDGKPLRPGKLARKFKLTVFVPETDLDKVSSALFEAGAGVIGNYEQCSFRLPGTGTFFGNESSNPTIGVKGQREEVSEWRLEVVVNEAQLSQAICAMRAAHSYEEPAFDIYPLHAHGTSSPDGEGRIGTIPATTLEELTRRVRQLLKANSVQYVGDPRTEIRVVALACGAAGSYLPDAIRSKADVFLTGEVRFHEALEAESEGVALIIPGHYATERPAVEVLAEKLQVEFAECQVWASRREKDPIRV